MAPLCWAPAWPAPRPIPSSSLQETYTAYLAAEGFRPELTASGNVKFRREGRSYLIIADEKDPTYFRMTWAFADEDKLAAARLRRLKAATWPRPK